MFSPKKSKYAQKFVFKHFLQPCAFSRRIDNPNHPRS